MSARTVAFLVTTLTILAIALTTGAAIYYLLFWMLVMMLALALESALATLFGLRVSASVQKSKTVRGGNVSICLRVRRFTLLPIGPVELELSSPEEDASWGHISIDLPPFKEKEYRYSMKCPHRGHYQVGVSSVRVADVFGLITLSRRVRHGNTSVTVTPRIYSVPPVAIDPGEMGSQGPVRISEDISSPSGVRNWQDGDRLKRVHWKLSIRKRELMVRTYEESAKPDMLLLMDVSPLNAARSQLLAIEDAMCDAAASSVLAQLNAGYPVRMPLATAQPTETFGQFPAQIDRFVDVLTDLRFDGPYSFEQVLSLEMRRVQRTAGVLLITARLNSMLADFAMRMHGVGVRVEFVWISESVTPEIMALKARLELNDIPVRRINPWD